MNATQAAAKAKTAAGARAARLVEPDMRVGLGSGSTAEAFVRALAARARGKAWRGLRCVATSVRTARLARALGLRLVGGALWQGPLDLCVDGVDEIDARGAIIKGAGGMLLRESIVARAARRFVVVADASKVSPRVGTFAPVPLVVARFGAAETLRRVAAVASGGATLRRDARGRPVRTDDGAWLIDARVGPLDDPAAMERALRVVPGVLATGLFLGLAPEIALGRAEGDATLCAASELSAG